MACFPELLDVSLALSLQLRLALASPVILDSPCFAFFGLLRLVLARFASTHFLVRRLPSPRFTLLQLVARPSMVAAASLRIALHCLAMPQLAFLPGCASQALPFSGTGK